MHDHSQFNSSLSLELHQRSCEYVSMLNPRWAEVRDHTLTRMPPLDDATLGKVQEIYVLPLVGNRRAT